MWISVVRYYVALVVLIGLQYGILMWLVIHPLALAKSLRQVGPVWAYVIVAVPGVLLAGTFLWLRDTILVTDYGTNYFLMALAVIPFALAVAIYLGHRKYLTLQILVGVPELTGSREGVLLTEGIYSRIRHPNTSSPSCGSSAMPCSPTIWPCMSLSC